MAQAHLAADAGVGEESWPELLAWVKKGERAIF